MAWISSFPTSRRRNTRQPAQRLRCAVRSTGSSASQRGCRKRRNARTPVRSYGVASPDIDGYALYVQFGAAKRRELSVSEIVGTAGPSNSGVVLGTVDNEQSALVCANRHLAAEY